ncbi:hypothetical protein [Shewanella hanedai]|nr:hypothetical protein [Shewanella hanedai]
MNDKIYTLLVSLLLLTGCNLATHGSFITQTYLADTDLITATQDQPMSKLGVVGGESCQTSVLYFIPYGESAATYKAIEDAKNQIEGTLLLTDISIDDKLWFEFGYSVQCILVSATAYGENRVSL